MKQKESFKKNLLDAILELLFVAFFGGIGVGIIYLFGKIPWDMDIDTLALIGLGAVVFLGTVIGAIIRFIKKKRKKKGNKNEPS